MNRTTLVCSLIAVLFFSCRASFDHHRQYVKTEPGTVSTGIIKPIETTGVKGASSTHSQPLQHNTIQQDEYKKKPGLIFICT